MKTWDRSWFEVGYADGFAGKDERVPEGYGPRMGYRRGYAQGETDRRLQVAGYGIKGPSDPALARG